MAGAGPSVEIKLVAKGGEQFFIDKESAEVCGFVAEFLKDGDANEAIELAEVDGPTLAKVTEFCKHYIASGKDYKELESPLKSTVMSELTGEWYAKFADDLQDNDVMNIMLATTYLDCKPLLDLACATLAARVKHVGMHGDGQTTYGPEALRRRFGIKNDFTPAEEEMVKAEWEIVSAPKKEPAST